MPGVLSGIASLFGSAVNYASAQQTNAANIAAQKEINAANTASQEKINAANIAYNKELNATQQAREDTSYQRAVADATAAGLSPLAVTGGASATTVSAPAMQSATQQAATSIAPQFDVNSAVDAYLQAQRNSETERANRAAEAENTRHNTAAEANDSATIATNRMKAQADIQTANKQLDVMKQNADTQSQKVINDSQQFAETLAEQKREHTKDYTMKMNEYLAQKATQITGHANYKVYHSEAEYNKALEEWTKSYKDYFGKNWRNISNDADSANNAFSGGLNIGSSGASVGANAGSSDGKSTNRSSRVNQFIKFFYETHPYPMYVPSSRPSPTAMNEHAYHR